MTSKIHALVDANGRPVALRLTGGHVHDSQEAEALLDAMPEGATLLADKGYDSNAIREAAASKNVWPTSRLAPTASNASPSRAGSIDSATWSNALQSHQALRWQKRLTAARISSADLVQR